MESDVTLAIGAEDNELAVWVAACLRRNLAANPASRRDFEAIRAAVAIVAPDRQLQCTLRFDHGHVTIHDGMLGVPDLTFCADFAVLLGLENFPLTRYGRLPLPVLSQRRAMLWRQSVMELMTGELKIYGLIQHPRLVTRILRLLSQG